MQLLMRPETTPIRRFQQSCTKLLQQSRATGIPELFEAKVPELPQHDTAWFDYNKLTNQIELLDMPADAHVSSFHVVMCPSSNMAVPSTVVCNVQYLVRACDETGELEFHARAHVGDQAAFVGPSLALQLHLVEEIPETNSRCVVLSQTMAFYSNPADMAPTAPSLPPTPTVAGNMMFGRDVNTFIGAKTNRHAGTQPFSTQPNDKSADHFQVHYLNMSPDETSQQRLAAPQGRHALCRKLGMFGLPVVESLCNQGIHMVIRISPPRRARSSTKPARRRFHLACTALPTVINSTMRWYIGGLASPGEDAPGAMQPAGNLIRIFTPSNESDDTDSDVDDRDGPDTTAVSSSSAGAASFRNATIPPVSAGFFSGLEMYENIMSPSMLSVSHTAHTIVCIRSAKSAMHTVSLFASHPKLADSMIRMLYVQVVMVLRRIGVLCGDQITSDVANVFSWIAKPSVHVPSMPHLALTEDVIVMAGHFAESHRSACTHDACLAKEILISSAAALHQRVAVQLDFMRAVWCQIRSHGVCCEELLRPVCDPLPKVPNPMPAVHVCAAMGVLIPFAGESVSAPDIVGSIIALMCTGVTEAQSDTNAVQSTVEFLAGQLQFLTSSEAGLIPDPPSPLRRAVTNIAKWMQHVSDCAWGIRPPTVRRSIIMSPSTDSDFMVPGLPASSPRQSTDSPSGRGAKRRAQVPPPLNADTSKRSRLTITTQPSGIGGDDEKQYILQTVPLSTPRGVNTQWSTSSGAPVTPRRIGGTRRSDGHGQGDGQNGDSSTGLNTLVEALFSPASAAQIQGKNFAPGVHSTGMSTRRTPRSGGISTPQAVRGTTPRHNFDPKAAGGNTGDGRGNPSSSSSSSSVIPTTEFNPNIPPSVDRQPTPLASNPGLPPLMHAPSGISINTSLVSPVATPSSMYDLSRSFSITSPAHNPDRLAIVSPSNAIPTSLFPIPQAIVVAETMPSPRIDMGPPRALPSPVASGSHGRRNKRGGARTPRHRRNRRDSDAVSETFTLSSIPRSAQSASNSPAAAATATPATMASDADNSTGGASASGSMAVTATAALSSNSNSHQVVVVQSPAAAEGAAALAASAELKFSHRKEYTHMFASDYVIWHKTLVGQLRVTIDNESVQGRWLIEHIVPQPRMNDYKEVHLVDSESMPFSLSKSKKSDWRTASRPKCNNFKISALIFNGQVRGFNVRLTLTPLPGVNPKAKFFGFARTRRFPHCFVVMNTRNNKSDAICASRSFTIAMDADGPDASTICEQAKLQFICEE
jgi:hypothetical protein